MSIENTQVQLTENRTMGKIDFILIYSMPSERNKKTHTHKTKSNERAKWRASEKKTHKNRKQSTIKIEAINCTVETQPRK